jgi:hypothetical protein
MLDMGLKEPERMKEIEVEGRELRYWDFEATDKDDDAKGAWVNKPVNGKITAPETLAEALESVGNKEERLVELIVNGLKAEAEERQGSAPQGTFSKAMVSQAVKALGVSPQFAKLERGDKRKAVMRFIGSNEAIKQGFLAGFESFRTARDQDEE